MLTKEQSENFIGIQYVEPGVEHALWNRGSHTYAVQLFPSPYEEDYFGPNCSQVCSEDSHCHNR